MRDIVLIESPYRDGDRNRNLRYLAWCELHSFNLGEVPIASHGNCTAYGPEDDAYRIQGFAWRDRVRDVCRRVAYYTDLGMSEGQLLAEERDVEAGVQIEHRRLPEDLRKRFDLGEYPPGSMMRLGRRGCSDAIEEVAINSAAKRMYDIAAAHGFHDNDGAGVTVERMASYVANLHGEVTELWEAARRGKLSAPCDKDCALTCAEEELADIVIRAMDAAVAMGIDLGRAITLKSIYNQGRPHMHGKLA